MFPVDMESLETRGGCWWFCWCKVTWTCYRGGNKPFSSGFKSWAEQRGFLFFFFLISVYSHVPRDLMVLRQNRGQRTGDGGDVGRGWKRKRTVEKAPFEAGSSNLSSSIQNPYSQPDPHCIFISKAQTCLIHFSHVVYLISPDLYLWLIDYW